MRPTPIADWSDSHRPSISVARGTAIDKPRASPDPIARVSEAQDGRGQGREPLGRRIGPSRGFRAAKRLLKRLAGRELRLRREIRLPTVAIGDWPYVPKLLTPGAVVCSFGIGDSIELERPLIEQLTRS